MRHKKGQSLLFTHPFTHSQSVKTVNHLFNRQRVQDQANTLSQEGAKLALWGATKKKHCDTRRNKACSLRRDQAKTLCHKKGQSLLSEERPSKNTVSEEGTKLTIWGETKQKLSVTRDKAYYLRREEAKNTVSQEGTKLAIWHITKVSKFTHPFTHSQSIKSQSFIQQTAGVRPSKHTVTRRGQACSLRRNQAKTLCHKKKQRGHLLSEERPSKNTVTRRNKAYYLRRDQAKTLLQGTKLTIWGETKQKHCYKGQSLLSEERPSKKHCHQKEQNLLSEERPSKNTVTRDKAYYPRRDQAKTLCHKKGPCLLDNISLKSTANSLICSPTVSPLKQSIIYSAGSRFETKQTHCVTRRSQFCHVTVSLKSANSLIHSPTVSLLKQLFTQHTVGSVLSSEACAP